MQHDLGGVWYNTLAGGWNCPINYAISQMYGGTLTNVAPNFSAMTVSNDASVPANGTLNITTTVSSPLGEAITYDVMFGNRYAPVPDGCGPAWCSLSNSGLYQAVFTQSRNTLTVDAPEWQGIWKVHVYAFDGEGNVGIDNASFLVVPSPVSGSDVALNKSVTGSSEQDASGSGCPCTGAMAVDGSLTTRWASAWSDLQWLAVNLGSPQTISTVQLVWENGCATQYQVQVSTDGTNWTTVYTQNYGVGGVETIPLNLSTQY